MNSTVANLQFLEVQLSQYLHEHEASSESDDAREPILEHTIQIPFQPTGPSYGDGYLWFADVSSRDVYRVVPTSGNSVLIGTINSVGNADWIAYNGGRVYVMNQSSGVIYVLNTSTGAEITNYVTDVPGIPTGLYHDGTHLWTADMFTGDELIHKLDPDDGTTVSTLTFPGGDVSIFGLTQFNGEWWIMGSTNVWVTDLGMNSILATYNGPSAGNGFGIASSSDRIYMIKQGGDSSHYYVYRLPNLELYVHPSGFRMPYKKTKDNLEQNMRHVEVQLDKYLHEHELSGSGEAELLPDPSVDLQQTAVPRFTDALTANDFYAWGTTDAPPDLAVTASTANPQASTQHIRIETINNIGDTIQILCVNPGLPGLIGGGTFRVAEVSPGDIITPSLYARKTPIFGSGFDDIDMIIDYFNSSSAYLSSDFETFGPMTTSYQQFTMSPVTAPANAAYIGFRFEPESFLAGDIVDIDTVSLAMGDPVTLYITDVGFRFPYDWEEAGAIKNNSKFLEEMISQYLHKHEVA